MKAGAPLENKNAETWTLETAKQLFDDAIKLSKDRDYDFIGEIARDLNTYREVFQYLSDKYNSLKHKHNVMLSNLEANCFSNSKKGKIKEATAIVNLKSNYKWTDRLQSENVNKNLDITNLTDEELEARIKQAERIG